MGTNQVLENGSKFTKALQTHRSLRVMLLTTLQNCTFHTHRSCKYLVARRMAPKTTRFQFVGPMSISA